MHACHSEHHPDHSKELKRLHRIKGQIEGVGKMIDDKRYCPDILNQIKAARSALKSLASEILKIHMNSCVKEAFRSQNPVQQEEKIRELVDAFNHFE